MPYTLFDHTHRLATWAAARAVHRGSPGLPTQRVITAIDSAGLRRIAESADRWACAEFDGLHRDLCNQIIAYLPVEGVVTYGRAAKIANVYFKVGVVCRAHDSESRARVAVFHPPVDRRLLSALAASSTGTLRRELQSLRDQGWSSFNCASYEAAIRAIRQWLDSRRQPQELWRVEECWRP